MVRVLICCSSVFTLLSAAVLVVLRQDCFLRCHFNDAFAHFLNFNVVFVNGNLQLFTTFFHGAFFLI